MPPPTQLPNEELPPAFRGRTHVDPSTVNITGVAGTVDVMVNAKSTNDEDHLERQAPPGGDGGDGCGGDGGGAALNAADGAGSDDGMSDGDGDGDDGTPDGEAGDEKSSELKSWVLDYVGREEAARKSAEEARLAEKAEVAELARLAALPARERLPVLSALLAAAADAVEEAARARAQGDNTFSDLDGGAAADFKRESRVNELKKRVSAAAAEVKRMDRAEARRKAVEAEAAMLAEDGEGTGAEAAEVGDEGMLDFWLEGADGGGGEDEEDEEGEGGEEGEGQAEGEPEEDDLGPLNKKGQKPEPVYRRINRNRKSTGGVSKKGGGKKGNKAMMITTQTGHAKWTGQTPKRLLEDWCRKHKAPPPRYQQMANSVSRVTIALSSVATTNSKGHKTRKGGRGGGGGGGRGRGKKEEVREDLVVNMEAPKAYLESNMVPAAPVERSSAISQMAMHNAATRALYELNKDLAMHTVLPPLFADLWKQWKSEEKEALTAADVIERTMKEERIQALAKEMRKTAAEKNNARGASSSGALGAGATKEAGGKASGTGAEEDAGTAAAAADEDSAIENVGGDGEALESWEDMLSDDEADGEGEAKTGGDGDGEGGDDVLESWEDFDASDEETTEADATDAPPDEPVLAAAAGVTDANEGVESDIDMSGNGGGDGVGGGGDNYDTSFDDRSYHPRNDRNNYTTMSADKLAAENRRLKRWWVERRQTPAWKRMACDRAELPMHRHRDELLGAVAQGNVSVVCGETGCGKTTQLPQYILEDALDRGNGAVTNIIVTQPRRVAATSVAERVSAEMGESGIGGTVGYAIKMESRRSANTRILFCTVGVLLRRLHTDPTLSGVSHVLIDEVHERQAQGDFLVTALRELIAGPRGGPPEQDGLKLVLMSATLDANLFCGYFGGIERCPLVHVEGRAHPINDYYLEDLLYATGVVIEEGSRCAVNQRESRKKNTEQFRLITVKGAGGKTYTQRVAWDSNEVKGAAGSGGVGDVKLDAALAEAKASGDPRAMGVWQSLSRVDETVINYDLIEETLAGQC